MARRLPAIIVKLRLGVGGVDVLSGVYGVIKVDKLFPDSADEELSTLYLVEIDRSDAESVTECIRNIEQVEYVEEAPARKML